MGRSECTVMICLTWCTPVAVATAWRVPILLEKAFCSAQAIMYSTPEAKFYSELVLQNQSKAERSSHF